VVKGGKVVGLISDHDIKVLTGTSPVGLAREIDKVASASELSRLTGRIRQMLDMLNRLCSSLEYMSALLSEFYDRLTVRLLQMVEVELEHEGLGPAPADYAWLALGCSGRGEQAPPCLQEHALLYSDRPGKEDPAVRQWFLTLAGRVSGLMEACGEARREGQAMASQDAWCHSQSAWAKTYTGWISEPGPGDVARAAAFFDFRAVMGEGGFAPALRRSLLQAVEKNRHFLRFLAKEAAERRPPLGFLRDQVVASGGAYSGVLDLDLDAMRPLVDSVRVLALDVKIEETNTLERLAALMRAGLINAEMGEDLQEAFKFVSELRIASYLQGGEPGEWACDQVEPVTLDRKQRKMLKDSFAVINELQDRVYRRYHGRQAVG
jgi:CBS domain-containing protein